MLLPHDTLANTCTCLAVMYWCVNMVLTSFFISEAEHILYVFADHCIFSFVKSFPSCLCYLFPVDLWEFLTHPGHKH